MPTSVTDLLCSGETSFTLIELSPGASYRAGADPDGRLLILEGESRGAYTTVPEVVTASALLIRGPRLGDPVDDVLGPEGWASSGPGQWFRLLYRPTGDERIVGVSRFEPGSASAWHPHPTAHRFYFLDGEADDEVLFPEGTRETAHRTRGDFVDYPYPVEHQTVSPTGCVIFFVHEAR
jgi:anti-sigma factor ChrR (cupin superfamily)